MSTSSQLIDKRKLLAFSLTAYRDLRLLIETAPLHKARHSPYDAILEKRFPAEIEVHGVLIKRGKNSYY